MYKHVKRFPARILWTRGCRRSIHPDRARDEDLHIFLMMSRESLKVAGRYIDRLLGPR